MTSQGSTFNFLPCRLFHPLVRVSHLVLVLPVREAGNTFSDIYYLGTMHFSEENWCVVWNGREKKYIYSSWLDNIKESYTPEAANHIAATKRIALSMWRKMVWCHTSCGYFIFF